MLYRRGTALVGLALVGFADHVVAQAQGDRLDCRHGVCQGREVPGIHSAHFLDDAEKAVELREHALTFF
ncbi:hypothetical protein D3C72_2050800 [compost metagenome]